MFNPFSRAPRGGAAWFNAGPVSAYPENTSDDGPLGQQRQCNDAFKPGCKVFHVPKEDATQASPVGIDDWKDGEGDTKDQVMVFRYGGKFVAVNHVSSRLIPALRPRRVHLVAVFFLGSFDLQINTIGARTDSLTLGRNARIARIH
jgi:hypothetical protein